MQSINERIDAIEVDFKLYASKFADLSAHTLINEEDVKSKLGKKDSQNLNKK